MGKKTKAKKKKQKSPHQTKRLKATFNLKSYWPLALILVLALVLYGQTFSYDFVYWDDDKNIIENIHVNSFTWQNFWTNSKEIFTSTVIGNYNPLPIWTFGIENAIYGINSPENFHFVNVFLHLISLLLVWRLGEKLGLNLIGVVILTFLFAIHPMRVESVAWVTERKDVLYGVFFLSACLQYLTFLNTKRKKNAVYMTIFFVLALFSKIQAVTFPLVMILLDYYHGKMNISWKIIFNKWPYFLLSLLTGVLGIYFLSEEGSIAANNIFGFVDRIFIGGYSLFVYIVKAIIPYQLSPLYPYPPSIPWYFYPSALSFILYGGLLYYSWKKDFRTLFFGLAFFFINIVFLLQIVGAGQGFLADRFTYIAYLGLFFILAFYIPQFLQESKLKKIVAPLLIIGGFIYSFITFKQVQVWKDSETLWTRVLDYYPTSTLAYGNMANYLRDQGKYREALENYNNSLAIKPDQEGTLNSRAKLFFTIGGSIDTIQLALQDYNAAINLNPQNGEYYINRGATYARLGNLDQAFIDIDYGLQLKPDHVSGYSNKFVLNMQRKNYSEALKAINAYLSYRPYDSNMHYERGNVKLILNSQDQSAIQDIEYAISINPRNAVFHYRKAEGLLYQNRIQEAKNAYRNAIQLGFTRARPEVAQQLAN